MNIIHPIEEHAKARPRQAAIVLPQRTITWEQLDGAVRATSALLRGHGLVPGDRVGLTIDPPFAHIVAALALTRIGVAHVAMPGKDPAAVREAVALKLRLKAVVAGDAALAPSGFPAIVIGDRPVTTDAAAGGEACDDGALTWLFLQSSGTTGAPKFAELSHAAAMDRFRRFVPMFDCGVNDVMWPASHPNFVVAKQRAVFALQAGAAVCFPAGLTAGPAMLEFLNRAGVTMACGTPSFLHELATWSEHAPAVPTLRVFEVRSATISERLRKTFRERFTPHLHVVYGTNEGEALALASPALQDQVPDTVGRPTAVLQLEVVDAAGQPVPEGVIGEVRVRGPGVITHYFENAEASAKSFRDGWFHPGDMASFAPGGALLLHGRTDDLMIFDGMNIYPAEIENALLAHPAVKDAAAFAVRHERVQDIPAAAVILAAPASAEELLEHGRQCLGFKHPRIVMVVKEFPRNAMGKVLKRQLAATAVAAAPQPDS